MNPIKLAITIVIGAVMGGGIVWSTASYREHLALPVANDAATTKVVVPTRWCLFAGDKVWQAPFAEENKYAGVWRSCSDSTQLFLPGLRYRHFSPQSLGKVSMKGTDWGFNFSATPTDLSPDLSFPAYGGWSLSFPRKSIDRLIQRQSVHFEGTTASPILTQGQYVKMSGSSPGMDCRMYFQKVSDDLSGQGQYDRWWSTKPLPRPNRLGNFVQFVGLEPEFWSTVTGERGDASGAATAGFQQALANPQRIGVMCDMEYVSHDPFAGDVIGFANAQDATFTMDSFAVCDPLAPSAKQENAACDPPRAP
jgi:hypothetical protein